MKMFAFSGPELVFLTPSMDQGERILSTLYWNGDIDSQDDYTATEVEVELK